MGDPRVWGVFGLSLGVKVTIVMTAQGVMTRRKSELVLVWATINVLSITTRSALVGLS